MSKQMDGQGTGRLMRTAPNTDFSISATDGLLRPARFFESPNQDERPDGGCPELLILHGISLPPGEFGGPYIAQLFTNCLDWNEHPYFTEIRDLNVSAHALIRRDGEVIQFVRFHQRAWHAGESTFRGQPQCNDYAVGIELEGSDDTPYTDEQYTVLAAVVKILIATYPGLSARRIAGHCDVAPARKTDPGPAFDWLRLYDALTVNDLSAPKNHPL